MYIPFNRKPNTTCDVCGKSIYIRPARLIVQNYKTCSIECSRIMRSKFFVGENNHQYGKRGKLNATYKGHTRRIKNGYVQVRIEEHPFSIGGFIREHRVIAEKHHLNSINSIEICGKLYLRPEYDVHHIDFDKTNNSPENLLVLTRSEHSRLHNEVKRQKKCSITGRFVKSK